MSGAFIVNGGQGPTGPTGATGPTGDSGAGTRVVVLTTPYAVLTTVGAVQTLLTVPGPAVVNLPPGATHTTGEVVVADGTGDATVNNITINASGGELINGAASQVIDGNYASLTFTWFGTSWSLT